MSIVQIVFPKDSIENDIIELYKGFFEAIANWDVPIVGCDLSKGDSWIIAVTVIGRVHQRPIYRSGAKRGESVWCTGTPGMSSIGLCLLQKYGREMAETIGKKYVDAHVRPTPRLTEGEQLLPFATSMMDLSDGIAKDLKTIAWDSGVSIKIVIPEVVEQNLSHGATLTPVSLEHHFLNGGEEYELLFTTSSEFNPNNFPFQLYKIGEVVDGPKGELILSRKGESSVVSTGGWDHC